MLLGVMQPQQLAVGRPRGQGLLWWQGSPPPLLPTRAPDLPFPEALLPQPRRRPRRQRIQPCLERRQRRRRQRRRRRLLRLLHHLSQTDAHGCPSGRRLGWVGR